MPTYTFRPIMGRIHQGAPTSFTRETSRQPRLIEDAVFSVLPGPLRPKVQTERFPKIAQGQVLMLNERGGDMET